MKRTIECIIIVCSIAIMVSGAMHGVTYADNLLQQSQEMGQAVARLQTIYLPYLTVYKPSTPTPTRTPSPTPSPTVQPGVIVLPNHFAYVDTFGYFLHIVGEVQNSTATHLRDVRIAANIFNRSGQLLDTDVTWTYLDNLPASEKTCFQLVMPQPMGWSYYEFERPIYRTGGEPLPNLTIFNHTGSYDPNNKSYRIVGLVRNDHATRVNNVSVIGTLYNSLGIVVGCEVAYINAFDLDPGQVSAFKMTFFGRDYADARSYRLQAEGNPQ